MPKVKISTTINEANSQLTILQKYYTDSLSLEPKFTYLIAEVILLHLFAIIERSLSMIAYKLASGAIYLSGKQPTLKITSKSIKSARDNMINYNRRKGIYLRWSKVKYIKESVEHVIDPSDPFIRTANIYAVEIDELRKVRNFIAHKNDKSRKDFKSVIRNRFGANLSLSVGAFLVSTKRVVNPIIHEYLKKSRIILSDFAKG